MAAVTLRRGLRGLRHPRRAMRRLLGEPAPAATKQPKSAKNAKLRRDAASLVARGVIDVEWYRVQRPHLPDDPMTVARHYLRVGRSRGLSPNPVFRPGTLTSRWRTTKVDPLLRYVDEPQEQPSHPLFDPEVHLAHYPEAADHPGGPLGHLLSSPEALPTPAVPVLGTHLPDWPEARARLVRAKHELVEGKRLMKMRWSERMPDAPRAELLRQARRWMIARTPGDVPLVSVVMPVRNRRDLVAAAVESVRAQSFADWELVVVDDGSTDGTPDRVREVAAGDPRIRVLERDPAGVSAARNAGLRAARGELVAFLDSDNEWCPDHLLLCVHALVEDGDLGGVHSVIRRDSEDGLDYLAFDGTPAHLRWVNYIDMNSLVVRAEVAEQAGGFDESLRRMVDWDFVIRVADLKPLRLVPYLGVRYSDDDGMADRISVSEPQSWGEVVIAKHLIDWDAAASRPRVAGRVSVLVVLDQPWRSTLVVDDLLARRDHPDLEVVVVDNSAPATTWEILRTKYDSDDRVVLTRLPRRTSVSVATNVALTLSSGEYVLVHDAAHRLTDGGIAQMLPLLGDAEVSGVQALVLGEDGAIANAGYGFSSLRALPVPLLAGHPAEDAETGEPRAVFAADRRGLLLRAVDLLRVRGFDPLLVDTGTDIDLSLRLGGTERPAFRVCTSARLRPKTWRRDEVVQRTGDSARIVLDRWAGRVPADLPAHLAASGLDLLDLRPTPRTGEVDPMVRRAATPALEVREQTPRLRWAIKTAAPAGPRGDVWGDVHFAEAVAEALKGLGQDVVVDRREAAVRPTSYLDDVVLTIRGLDRVDPQPGRFTLLWVISHPELVSVAELAEQDKVFAASVPWSAKMTASTGVPVEPLLQATDTALFHPGRRGEFPAEDVLFVGSSRNVFRWIVRESLEQGVPVSIYGPNWASFLRPEQIKAPGIPNRKLGAAYASAGVVLNDHWTTMAHHGFISNRVFDAIAAGAVVVSDRAEGIEDLFGGMVQVADDGADLRRLTGPGRDAYFPSAERREEISTQVREAHSFDKRAHQLLDAVLELRAKQGQGSER